MSTPQVFAHRGFADRYPENTVHAVRSAARHASAVEIDVRRCGSGELVVFHDDELDRVTDGEGRIDEIPLTELQRLRVEGSEETVPTFDELAAAVPDEIRVNVELKESGVAEETVETCRTHGVDAIYSSFYDDAIHEVRSVASEAPIAVLCHESQPVDERLALAETLDAEAFHPSLELVDAWADPDDPRLVASLDRRGVGVPAEETMGAGSDVVALAHAFGLDVNVWTAETSADVARLRDRGVDGIMVDHPEVAAPLVR